MKKKGCIRKRKKRTKKALRKYFNKVNDMIAEINYSSTKMQNQIDETTRAFKSLLHAIPYHNEDPITRCDRLIELKR